ncbi:hypothetical protein [Glutamicibacter sp. M10]|uniref:hypothetical protein n=1 Tax=Glutamicibacter sp. M10 TaxID=3023076 RepID=UPI0021CA843C|nr:hypothetical protein [Glutamicibacter sp. M10]UXN33386.1 hypothetical protein N6V40_08385 [Glutamicibacter sp. M10]
MNTIGLFGGFLGPYVMGLLEEITGNKMSGLWFIVAMCVMGALLTLKLRRGTEDPSAANGSGH